jgi:hypothetical protein
MVDHSVRILLKAKKRGKNDIPEKKNSINRTLISLKSSDNNSLHMGGYAIGLRYVRAEGG